MNGITKTAIRTISGFSVLLILTRLISEKQLGQLNIFTYITGIAIGSMAGEIVIHKETNFLDGLTSLVIWRIMVFLIEVLSLKNSKARVLIKL